MITITLQPINRTSIEKINLNGEIILDVNHTTEQYCKVKYDLFAGDNTYLESIWINYTPDELSTWGDDDMILIDLALAKLGWTKSDI